MTAVVTRELSAVELAVLETVAYADVFDSPLTAAEVWRWLPRPATFDEVERALSRLTPDLLGRSTSFYHLPGREELVAVRQRRQAASAALRRKADWYGSLIARLPFVRMVALTGSLAVENSDAGDDIDYLIVTRPGRLWLTRAMTMLAVRFAGLRGVTLCPNYFLAETVLALPNHDLYTARELQQMTPLSGREVFELMLAANAWWRDVLPNAEASDALAGRPSKSQPLRRIAEAILRTPVGSIPEAWLQRHKAAELRAQAGDNAEAVFDATMCKGHFEGYRRRTSEAVAVRLAALLEGRP